MQSHDNSLNHIPHTCCGCSHYSPASVVPHLAAGNLAFYFPAPLVKNTQISRLNNTKLQWGIMSMHSANMLLPQCCEAAATCFTLCYKAAAFSGHPQYNTTQAHTVNPLSPHVLSTCFNCQHKTTKCNFSANCDYWTMRVFFSLPFILCMMNIKK